MASANRQVRVKKVPAYPFPIKIGHVKGELMGQVVKAGGNGVVVDARGFNLKIGDKLDMTFELPVFKKTIAERGVVVKIYSQLDESRAGTQLVEIHYTQLSKKNRDIIAQFLAAAGSN